MLESEVLVLHLDKNALNFRMSSVLSQLLPIEGHLDQTIVKHCLVQLLKQDTSAAISGIINQVIFLF